MRTDHGQHTYLAASFLLRPSARQLFRITSGRLPGKTRCWAKGPHPSSLLSSLHDSNDFELPERLGTPSEATPSMMSMPDCLEYHGTATGLGVKPAVGVKPPHCMTTLLPTSIENCFLVATATPHGCKMPSLCFMTHSVARLLQPIQCCRASTMFCASGTKNNSDPYAFKVFGSVGATDPCCWIDVSLNSSTH